MTFYPCWLWHLLTIPFCVLGVSGSLSLSPNIGPVKTVVKGTSCAVTCFENDGEGKLQWSRVPGPKRVFTNFVNFGEKGGLMLYLNNVQESDGAVYQCKNMASGESISFQLLFHEPVVFVDTPTTQTGTAGEVMTVRCEATGKPEPTLKWAGPNHQRELLPDKYQIVGDGLVINDLSVEDAGPYQCIALQTGIYSFESVVIDVKVQYMPEWIDENRREVVFKTAAAMAELSCRHKGDPQPSVTWLLNEQVISENVDVLIVNSTGSYQCRVNNTLGEIHRNFTVKEGHLPGRPSNVKPHNVTSNSFSVGFSPPAHNATQHKITGYRIEISSQKGNHRQHVNISGDPSVVTVTDLLPNTVYIIRLRAENEVGLGESLEVKATTRSGANSLLPAFTVLLLLYFVTTQC